MIRTRFVVGSLLLVVSLEALPASTRQSPGSLSPTGFVDVTRQAGIDFRHVNAATGEKFLVETMGPGCAWLDYNGDGFMDLYFVNGRALPGFRTDKPLRNALYRNNRNGTFTDVTIAAGVAGSAYGMGVTVADVDNDGLPDIYLTNFGRNQLYHNSGNGTFSDITAKAGLAAAGWSASAAFADFDGDEFLDLYVTRYLDFDLRNNVRCGAEAIRDYCHPSEYHGVQDLLFRNNGNLTFTDVSVSAGISRKSGKGLGVLAADFDRNGWMDLYVANDMEANFLYLNQKNGTFREVGELSGVAYDALGTVQSGMGIATKDYDHNGFLDILVTNLSNQGYVLYRNDGDGSYTDVSFPAGVGRPSLPLTGWGTAFLDVDNSGGTFLAAANGHVMEQIERVNEGVKYLQPLLLLKLTGPAFTDVTSAYGLALSEPRPARGLGVGDMDNDGRLDVIVCNCNREPVLLRNLVASQNHWLKIQLVGTRSNRDGVGARVRVRADGRIQELDRTGGGSYLSSSDPRLHFGLGKAAIVEELEVFWPSGGYQKLEHVRVDQTLRLIEPGSRRKVSQ